jgi:hypothetical protein
MKSYLFILLLLLSVVACEDLNGPLIVVNVKIIGGNITSVRKGKWTAEWGVDKGNEISYSFIKEIDHSEGTFEVPEGSSVSIKFDAEEGYKESGSARTNGNVDYEFQGTSCFFLNVSKYSSYEIVLDTICLFVN